MVIIELQNVRFHGFHGIYDGEQKTGSPYEVTVKVIYEEHHTQFDNLKNTINYVEVFEMVKERMGIPTPLLEKVAEGIAQAIKHKYSFTKEIMVTVYKLEAPIENLQGKIGVTVHKHFND